MKQQKIIIILIATLLTEYCSAQFTDNFSDGDFTNNPTWSGEVARFTVVTGKLKLSAPAVGESTFLAVSSQSIHNASWEFSIQLDFNPSATNYAKIYLVSDQSNLYGNLNGYFIKVGNTTRDVCLYRQNGIVETKLIDGVDDILNVSQIKIRIKATRSETGEWKLFTDMGMSGSYSADGVTTDNVNTISSYFGIVCTYTATRSDKFWFDDFVVSGIPVPDTTPPSIISVTTPASKQVNILFSEPIVKSNAENLVNYSFVDHESPTSALLQPDQRTVVLNFQTPLTNGFAYSLQVKALTDLPGNIMPLTNVTCMFFEPVDSHNKDIIFTEMFPDPSPQIGLPNAEFVEIFNRSNAPFNLSGWKLTDGSSVATLPSQIILPGEYRIITSSSSMNLFSSMGKTIGLQNFPTLNNDGDTFVLKDSKNITIDSVSYTIDWYRDQDKQLGGWTLELIDPANPCGEEDNWMASEDKSGGTPGRKNSVFANKPDISAPLLLSVFPRSPSELLLTFNEKLDRRSLEPGNYDLYPSIAILQPSFIDKGQRSILIKTLNDFKKGEAYVIETKNISDCNLNHSALSTLGFGLPEVPDSLDVVVNEILFNPRTGGVDFLEVKNVSKKYLSLKDWKLGNYNNGVIGNEVTLFSGNTLLSPDSLIVFTTNPSIIMAQYVNSREKNLYKTPLPSMSDDAGSIAVMSNTGNVLDEVSYSRDWHSVFIKSDEGVSLERIAAFSPSNDRNNWNSASSSSGYATPGLPNSQQRAEIKTDESNVTVTPEIFSPASGANQFVQIQYRFDETPVANVKVFDAQGHLLKTIASNETLGTEGSFRWDGDRDNGTKARAGYCVVWFEIFTSSGSVKTFRKRVVVNSN